MSIRDFRRGHHEQWSERYQTLRHSGEKLPEDDDALLHDPWDYSAIGGPDDERIYGHTRSDNGSYPWNAFGDSYEEDSRADQRERGGYWKLHGPSYGRPGNPSDTPKR
jgi:hypothetical protein